MVVSVVIFGLLLFKAIGVWLICAEVRKMRRGIDEVMVNTYGTRMAVGRMNRGPGVSGITEDGRAVVRNDD
jgi:hypothetical protein